jgi:hypothetical protein
MKRKIQTGKALIIETKDGKITIRVAGRILDVMRFKSLDDALTEAERILGGENEPRQKHADERDLPDHVSGGRER